MARKRGEHYLVNQEANERIINYLSLVKEAKSEEKQIPVIPDRIYKDIKLVAERMATRRNFSGYTYKDEMVGHAIEVCLKAIQKYDPSRTTLSGKPNPHGFLSICVWNAFLEVIKKEKKQELIRKNIINQRTPEDFFVLDSPDGGSYHYIVDAIVNKSDSLKSISF